MELRCFVVKVVAGKKLLLLGAGAHGLFRGGVLWRTTAA